MESIFFELIKQISSKIISHLEARPLSNGLQIILTKRKNSWLETRIRSLKKNPYQLEPVSECKMSSVDDRI